MSDDKILKWLSEEYVVEETSIEQQKKSYEKRIVGWLDILGIRSMIKNDKEYDAEAIINIMASLSSYVSSTCDKYCAENKLFYHQISDGIIIAADVSLASEVCAIMAEVQWKILVNLNLLSRGALTVGNVSVENGGSLIIGPAYVDVYVMESENAIYARKILSKTFMNETMCNVDFIAEDTDKLMYIDYIAYIMKKQKIDEKRMKKILIEQGVSRFLKENYNPNNTERISIAQKYGWTMALLDRNKISDL